MPDVNIKCISHSSRKSPVVATESRLQRQKVSVNPHQLVITNISTEINPEIMKKVNLAHSTLQPASTNGGINEESIKNKYVIANDRFKDVKSEKGTIAILGESQDKLDGEISGIEELKEKLGNCKDKCKKAAIATDLSRKSHHIVTTYVEHSEHVTELAANMVAHPENADKNTAKEVTVLLSRAEKSGVRLNKNLEALYILNPKLFSGLKPLIEKTSKLIDKLRLMSAKFEELRKKIADLTKKEADKNESTDNKLFFLSDEKTDPIIETMIEREKEEKEEQRKDFAAKALLRKKEEKMTEDLFSETIENKQKEKTNILKILSGLPV